MNPPRNLRFRPVSNRGASRVRLGLPAQRGGPALLPVRGDSLSDPSAGTRWSARAHRDRNSRARRPGRVSPNETNGTESAVRTGLRGAASVAGARRARGTSPGGAWDGRRSRSPRPRATAAVPSALREPGPPSAVRTPSRRGRTSSPHPRRGRRWSTPPSLSRIRPGSRPPRRSRRRGGMSKATVIGDGIGAAVGSRPANATIGDAGVGRHSDGRGDAGGDRAGRARSADPVARRIFVTRTASNRALSRRPVPTHKPEGRPANHPRHGKPSDRLRRGESGARLSGRFRFRFAQENRLRAAT